MLQSRHEERRTRRKKLKRRDAAKVDQVTDIRLEIEAKELKREEEKRGRECGSKRELATRTFAIEALFSEKSIVVGGVSRCTQTCTTGREEKGRRI